MKFKIEKNPNGGDHEIPAGYMWCGYARKSRKIHNPLYIVTLEGADWLKNVPVVRTDDVEQGKQEIFITMNNRLKELLEFVPQEILEKQHADSSTT